MFVHDVNSLRSSCKLFGCVSDSRFFFCFYSGVTDDYVDIELSATSEDCQVNAELVNYLASVLQVKRTNIIVEKGLRDQIKLAIVNKNGLTVERVKRLITEAVSTGTK